MWWSLISTWLRLRRTVPVYSITGQCILCLKDKFAAFSWNCVITKAYVTSKIASYSRDMQCLLRTTSVWSLQTALIYKTRWIAAPVVVYSPTRWICVYLKLFQDHGSHLNASIHLFSSTQDSRTFIYFWHLMLNSWLILMVVL